MIPDKETRDIQAYLNDTLPQVRRDKFELRLQNEPEFKARFEELKPILETIEDIQYANRIREIVEEAKKNEPGGNLILLDGLDEENKIAATKRKPKFNKFFQYGIAASLFLILSGIVWYDSTSNLRIYDDNYSPQAKYSGSKIEECPDNTSLNLYYSTDYISFFEILKKKPETPCINYYIGLCYLEFKQYTNAEPLFLKGVSSDDVYVKQSSEWYLGLTYIKLNELEKAKTLFQKIVTESEHQYNSSAKIVLNDLKKKPLLFRLNF
jgi:hypothetical protein